MKKTEHQLRVERIEADLAKMRSMLAGHSEFIVHKFLPMMDRLQEDMERLWISSDRFTELERAVAELAGAFYERRTGKSIDSRVRPRR